MLWVKINTDRKKMKSAGVSLIIEIKKKNINEKNIFIYSLK
jgi:hypothetical protein